MAQLSGEIKNMGILDLSWAKTPEDLSEITSLSQIGVVQVPRNLYKTVMAIPMDQVGLVQPIPDGPYTELAGQNRITGEFLANGDPETTLLLMGQAMVIPPVTEVGFANIEVMGQLILPRGHEGILSSKLGKVKGHILYCSFEHGEPRLIMGEETIGAEFLELLPGTTTIVVMGKLTLADDVTVELLRETVAEIILLGELSVPPQLAAIARVLAPQKLGEIVVREA